MLFCDKFQTFGQLFSDFNVMLTLSPYYKKLRGSFIKEKRCFSKNQGIEKPSLFDALILILGFYS